MTKKIICPRCGTVNKLPTHVSKAVDIRGAAYCIHCGRALPSPNRIPPSQAQLDYIKALGGSIAGITDRKKAAEAIARLKRW